MTSETCANCEHFVEFNGKMVCDYDTLYYNDMPFVTTPHHSCDKFKPQEEETCENCGHKAIVHHISGMCLNDMKCLCKKFIPQSNDLYTNSNHQNHTPTQSGELITSGRCGNEGLITSRGQNHSPRVDVGINGSNPSLEDTNNRGSDDASSLSDYIIDYDGKKAMHILYPVISQARVKESVQKLKEEFWVNEVIIARIDKIFGKKLI